MLFVRLAGLTLPLWIVGGWSAAEAAIFFIVADVPISWIAVRRGTRAAMLAAVVAALASALGAATLWLWFAQAPLAATASVVALPGIDSKTLATAGAIYDRGYAAIILASFQGIPFKLFVLEAAERGEWLILILAPLLRLPRFLGVAFLVGTLSRFLGRLLNSNQRLALLLVAWIAFYGWYWSVMPR